MIASICLSLSPYPQRFPRFHPFANPCLSSLEFLVCTYLAVGKSVLPLNPRAGPWPEQRCFTHLYPLSYLDHKGRRSPPPPSGGDGFRAGGEMGSRGHYSRGLTALVRPLTENCSGKWWLDPKLPARPLFLKMDWSSLWVMWLNAGCWWEGLTRWKLHLSVSKYASQD